MPQIADKTITFCDKYSDHKTILSLPNNEQNAQASVATMHNSTTQVKPPISTSRNKQNRLL